MTLSLDQATIFTEFTQIIPVEVSSVIRPHIAGPQAELHRYSVASEKANISLGTYISGTGTAYSWPDLTLGAIVDQTFAAVFIDSALLNYFSDPIGSGSGTITPVTNFPSRIKTNATDGFKSNGPSFPRDALLFDRDVQVGDIVFLNDGAGHTMYSSVNNLIADVVSASIGSATSDSGNHTTQGGSSSTTQTSGTVNDVAATDSIASYNGLPSGDIDEIYTITVTQGSTGGNATTALVSVTSASGRDDQASVAPSAFGSPTNIGTRGLTVTWTHTVDDLLVGQIWTVTVHQAFTAPSATSGGTYTGSQSITYIITVTLGGHYSDPTKPQITVTSDIGTDMSGPTNVTAAASNVACGTLGVLVQFNQTALRKGDKYYIVVTGPTTGAYKTIELKDNLTTPLQAASDMDLELYIQKNIQVPNRRLSSPGVFNWNTSPTQITIHSGINAQDPTLTNGGNPFWVPVKSGPSTTVYAQYRAWLSTWVNKIGQITVATGSDPFAAVGAVLGTVDPNNPLAYAVYKAVQNANATTVQFSGVGDPTIIGNWQEVLNMLVNWPAFSLVPLSHDPVVLADYQAHVDAQSAEVVNGFRNAWFTLQAQPTVALVTTATTTDHSVALATVAQDPSHAGQYTYLVCTSGNAAFITNGVTAGDIVRYQFSTDAWGSPTWNEYTVASVVNQNTLLLVLPGTGAPVSTPQKVEVWRNQSKDQQAAQLAGIASGYDDQRIRAVWPDLIETPDGQVDGFFLAAALAGFTGGIASQQGIKGIPLTGFIGASRSIGYFGNGQLNTLAAGGAYVVTQDGSGNVFARNTLTTDLSSVATEQEVTQRNDDATRLVIFKRVAQFFDVTRAADSTLTMLQSEVSSGLQVLASGTFISRTGNMITSWTITDLRFSVTSPDRVVLQITIVRPLAIDALDMTLVFQTE